MALEPSVIHINGTRTLRSESGPIVGGEMTALKRLKMSTRDWARRSVCVKFRVVSHRSGAVCAGLRRGLDGSPLSLPPLISYHPQGPYFPLSHNWLLCRNWEPSSCVAKRRGINSTLILNNGPCDPRDEVDHHPPSLGSSLLLALQATGGLTGQRARHVSVKHVAGCDIIM